MINDKLIKFKPSSNIYIKIKSFEKGLNASVDENILPYSSAKHIYNFKIDNGALSSGYGFDFLKLPTCDEFGDPETLKVYSYDNGGILNMWHFFYYQDSTSKRMDLILFFGASGIMYAFDVFDFPRNEMEFEECSFSSEPVGMYYWYNNLDTMIFSSPKASEDMVIMNDSGITRCLNAPKIVDMCRHYDRVFAIVEGSRKKIAYSDNLDPTIWHSSMAEGKYIELADERGEILRLISFNDYIYAFRENGITRISAYGDNEKFNITNMWITNSKIYGKTVTLCEDRVMYMQRNAIYEFNGSSANKLDLGFEELFENVYNENAVGAYLKGKYYLACRLDFMDDTRVGCELGEYVNNALVEIDVETKQISIMRGVDIKSLCPLENRTVSKLLASFRGERKTYIGQLTKDGKFFGNPLKRVWSSPYSDLGYPAKNKKIKEITLISKSDITVQIKTDKETKEYHVYGKPIVQRIKTNVVGKQVQLSFISNGDNLPYISSPQLKVGIM